MDEHNILDAPENDGNALKISLKALLLGVLGMMAIYFLFFHLALVKGLSNSKIDFWIIRVDLTQTMFLAFTSIGLYFFMSFIKFEISHWFRVMSVSVTIVLIAIVLSLSITQMKSISELFQDLKIVVFISLIAGGGCSLAIQFLHKKHYFIFSAVMICTIVFFSLLEYL